MRLKSIKIEYDFGNVEFEQVLNDDDKVYIEFEDGGLFSFCNAEELEDFIQRLTELKKLFKPE